MCNLRNTACFYIYRCMVAIVRIALQRPYYVCGPSPCSFSSSGPACGRYETPGRHLPGHTHPGNQRRLAIHRPAARPDGWPCQRRPVRARAWTTTVNDNRAHRGQLLQRLRHCQKSSSQPNVAISVRPMAQVTAIKSADIAKKQLPPGATPPLILNYNASTVSNRPARRLSGKGLSEQAPRLTSDLNVVRITLVTVPGAGDFLSFRRENRAKCRSISIPQALQGARLSAQDRKPMPLAAQKPSSRPVGTQKIGSFEYPNPAQQRRRR